MIVDAMDHPLVRFNVMDALTLFENSHYYTLFKCYVPTWNMLWGNEGTHLHLFLRRVLALQQLPARMMTAIKVDGFAEVLSHKSASWWVLLKRTQHQRSHTQTSASTVWLHLDLVLLMKCGNSVCNCKAMLRFFVGEAGLLFTSGSLFQ